MSRISDVVESAATEIQASGSVGHLYETCVQDGSVNAARPDVGEADGVLLIDPPCTACALVQIGEEIRESKLASEEEL